MDNLTVGQQVTHGTFGTGTVIEIKEQSLVVVFGDGAVRQIANEFLTPGDLYGSVQIDGGTADLEASIDALISQIKEHRQRTRPQRLLEGGMLYALQHACKQSGKRDFTKIITDDLGYARQTAYDLIRDYKAEAGATKLSVEPHSASAKSAEPRYETADADDVVTPAADPQADKINELIKAERGKRDGHRATDHKTDLHVRLIKLLTEDLEAYHIYRREHPDEVKSLWLATFNEIVGLQRAADAEAEANHYRASDEDLPPIIREGGEHHALITCLDEGEGQLDMPSYAAHAEGA